MSKEQVKEKVIAIIGYDMAGADSVDAYLADMVLDAIKTNCHRYIDGRKIDPKADGYWWMNSCDIEQRSAYLPIGRGGAQ